MSSEQFLDEEHAILLRSEDSGEADRRIALLGEEHGLLWVTARGARRSKKRFVGLLEPFTRGLFRLGRRKRTIYLEGVELQGRRDRIPGDLGRFYLASYLCELTSRALRVGSPAPEVFALLREHLDELQESSAVLHLRWRALFEADLLEIQGLFPRLDPELVEVGRATLDIHAGGWVSPSAAPIPGGLRVELPATIWARFLAARELPLSEVRKLSWPAQEMRLVNRITALLVRSHLQLRLNSEGLLNRFQRGALQEEQNKPA
jgi:DNA repair protein RecO (recombination protein O)